MPKTTPRYQLGDYWLSKQSRSPSWCRTWYDKRTEQTKRVSLRTENFDEAKAKLDDWFVLEHQRQGQKCDDVLISTLFARYYEKHASKLKSAQDYQITLRYWVEFHGDATISEAASLNRQEEFRAWLQASKGLSKNSIRKTITIGKSAINWAYKRGEIDRAPYFEQIIVPPSPPKGRHLEIQEVGKLLKTTDLLHLKLFILLLIGTAARPQAIYDLCYDQIDFENNLIDLNPKGFVPSKNKRRPIVKLPSALARVLQEQKSKSINQKIIAYNGKPINSLRTAWRKLRKDAGFDQDVMLYSIRRTMARHMRLKGVPAWEIAEQLGHRATGYQITELYTAHSPDYLENAITVLDAYLQELSCEFRVNCLSELVEENPKKRYDTGV